MSLKSVIKTILGNLNAVGAGGMLARTTYSPTTADPATPIVSSTGLTSLNFTTGVDRPITFTVPTSGAVLVRITCFVKGGAAAGTSVVLGLTSNAHTSSPGTVVGTTGLVYLTPTATAADNGSLVTYAQVVTGLTAAAATTLVSRRHVLGHRSLDHRPGTDWRHHRSYRCSVRHRGVGRMTHVLEAPIRYWKCPSCLTVDRTQRADVHTQFHDCPALGNAAIPLVEVSDPDEKAGPPTGRAKRARPTGSGGADGAHGWVQRRNRLRPAPQ